MGIKIETLGYPSRTEAIVALKSQGHPYKEIAEMTGVKIGTVGALLNTSKRLSAEDQRQQTLKIDRKMFDTFHPAANKRGISVNQLCRRILSIIADDNLVSAILDDET